MKLSRRIAFALIVGISLGFASCQLSCRQRVGRELAAVARTGWLRHLKRKKPSLRMESDQKHQVENRDRRPRTFIAHRLGQDGVSDHRG